MSTDVDGIDSEPTVDEFSMISDSDSTPDENSDRDSITISSQSHPIRDEDEAVSQSQQDSQASQLQTEHISKISDIHAEITQLNQLIEAQQRTLEMHSEILNQLVEDLRRYTDDHDSRPSTIRTHEGPNGPSSPAGTCRKCPVDRSEPQRRHL
mgnify:CR=1 FL=1